ncbi:hypothetical protein GCM10010303_10250 [Streptomyces purpurascens]|nr:hypothetical protein GCM10010303_10250 [Streptomyces purpurascens]
MRTPAGDSCRGQQADERVRGAMLHACSGSAAPTRHSRCAPAQPPSPGFTCPTCYRPQVTEAWGPAEFPLAIEAKDLRQRLRDKSAWVIVLLAPVRNGVM